MVPYYFSCHSWPANIIKQSQKNSKLSKMTTTNQLSITINGHASAQDVLMILCCALFTVIIYLLTADKFSAVLNIFRSAEPSRPSRRNTYNSLKSIFVPIIV